MRFGPLFKIRERLVEPQGEARNDFLILAELAQRLGYGDLYPQSEEEVLRFALEPSGFTLEEVRAAGGEVRVPTVMMQYKKWEKGLLRPDGRPGFNTPSGKFEIASSILAEHGYDRASRLHGARRGATRQPRPGKEIPAGVQFGREDGIRLPQPASRRARAGRAAFGAAGYAEPGGCRGTGDRARRAGVGGDAAGSSPLHCQNHRRHGARINRRRDGRRRAARQDRRGRSAT